jgi:hypothetical protein
MKCWDPVFARLDDTRERQSRLEVRASKKRELALQAMSETGLTKLEQPDLPLDPRGRLSPLEMHPLQPEQQQSLELLWMRLQEKMCPDYDSGE